LKARATNKSGTKMEGHNGGLEAVPPVGIRGKAPGHGVRGQSSLKLTTFY